MDGREAEGVSLSRAWRGAKGMCVPSVGEHLQKKGSAERVERVSSVSIITNTFYRNESEDCIYL